MKNKRRRKIQRGFNRIVREMNTALEKDPLWRGRFFGRQIRAEYWADDVSLWIEMELRDKKTLKTRRFRISVYDPNDRYNFIGAKLFMEMNKFIVEDCAVWEYKDRKDSPYEDKTNYAQIDWDKINNK